MKPLPVYTLTASAIEYVWRELARRAGVEGVTRRGTGFENLGIPVRYGEPPSSPGERPGIFVVPCEPTAYWRLLEQPAKGLDCLRIEDALPQVYGRPFEGEVPILLWGKGYEQGHIPFAELLADGSLLIYVDILAATFFLLSRWEETVLPDRDHYNRFPATASVAYKYGCLDRPLVDEYALILRSWLRRLLPTWQPRRRPFSVKLSHDIDAISDSPADWRRAIRVCARHLLRHHNPKDALCSIEQTVLAAVAPTRTSHFQDIYWLADVSCKNGLGDDAFYFQASEPGPYDNGYDPGKPAVRRCINDLRQDGFEIGLHPGYSTLNDLEKLQREKTRLEQILEHTLFGGRQHYLRFHVPNTWRHFEEVGLAYDATLGYPDYEGFRCGTCHPFRPFDVEQNRELDLWEWPLVVMDRTLQHYRGLSPAQAEERILELAQRSRRVEGTFTLLWHNSSRDDKGRPWHTMYERVVARLAAMR